MKEFFYLLVAVPILVLLSGILGPDIGYKILDIVRAFPWP
jgi:hypothetical protein